MKYIWLATIAVIVILLSNSLGLAQVCDIAGTWTNRDGSWKLEVEQRQDGDLTRVGVVDKKYDIYSRGYVNSESHRRAGDRDVSGYIAQLKNSSTKYVPGYNYGGFYIDWGSDCNTFWYNLDPGTNALALGLTVDKASDEFFRLGTPIPPQGAVTPTESQKAIQPGTISGPIGQLVLTTTPLGAPTVVKPGDRIALAKGQKAELRALCEELKQIALLMSITYDEGPAELENLTELAKPFAPILKQEFLDRYHSLKRGVETAQLVIAIYIIKCGPLLSENESVPLAEEVTSTGQAFAFSLEPAAQLKLNLQQGAIRPEVINDQVSLDVETDSMTVSSVGKNTFIIAYDPSSSDSLVIAYQNPLYIQPKNSNLLPITLNGGQMVIVGLESASSIIPFTPGAVQTGMENDVDRPGNDYRSFDLSSPDPALCKQACDDDPNCKAFTYVKPGIQGVSARCWLKNVVPSAVSSSCCISGVKEEVTDKQAQILDHAMASNVDESTNDVIMRTNVFSSTDSKAYSWLSLGNIRAGTVEWRWYSPDGVLYRTVSVNIPAPSRAYWDAYNVWSYIIVAGGNAANLPSNWYVDVYLDGRKLLTEQFTIVSSGVSGVILAKPLIGILGSGIPETLRECEAYDTEVCGTWTLEGDHFNANWDTGDTGTVRIERWDAGGVVLTRYESEGISAGLSARYEGQISGNKIVNGVVTWTLDGDTWSGTWSAEWTETAGLISISASPSIASPGGTITVTYSGAPGFEYDWIAIFKVGDPNTSYSEYYYLHKQKSGTLTFTAPSTGDYEFRLFENFPDGDYNDLARSNTIRIKE